MTNQQKIEFLYGMKIVVRNQSKRFGNLLTVFGYATVFYDTAKHWVNEDQNKNYISVWSDIISALKPIKQREISLDSPKEFSNNIQIVINHLKTQPNEPTLY